MSWVGDVDGDDHDDVLASAAWGTSGAVVVYSGLTGSILHLKSGSLGGEFVAGVGDVDDDGVPDFAGAGSSVRVWSGADGSQLHFIPGADSVAGIGDLNGDGNADFVVGSPSSSFAGGLVRVFSGRDGVVLQIMASAQPGEMLGQSVQRSPGRTAPLTGLAPGDARSGKITFFA